MNYTKDGNTEFAPAPADRPLLATEVVIFTIRESQLQVLLVRREIPPYLEMWALPGGYVCVSEALNSAAMRELAEITGAKDVYLEQLYTFGDPQRDPRAHVVSVAYFALVSADKLNLRTSNAAAEIAWHHMYDLPPLAFDHRDILDYALTRLRYKLEYTAVAFQLLPEEFTLRELQDVYNVILNDPELDKRNFRKKLLRNNVVASTGNLRNTGGRPAKLYRFSETQPVEIRARRLFP